MNIPLIVLVAVFGLIAVRQVARVQLQIWQVMLGGSVVVLLTGSISPGVALQAINLDVMIFLAAMFVVGNALEQSGYLAHLSYQYVKRARSRNSLLLMIMLSAGLASAVLMNDTLAIIGTPVVLLLARKHAMSSKVLLLALAFSVTIGSVMSPIGNPQNLLIALNGRMENPFVTFLAWLAIPTLVNLWLSFIVVQRMFPDDFHDAELQHSQEPIRDRSLAFLAKLSLQMILVLIAVKVAMAIATVPLNLELTHIAVAGALPIVLGSAKRWRILRALDWHTLVYFAAMFVLMESVWQSGFFQSLLQRADVPLTSIEMIMMVSIVLSQFISNVPLVALYQPMLLEAGATNAELMTLAAASTIAGNMFILGAASNVIVIQNAERKGKETLSFWEFARAGIPVTLLNAVVYWAWFALLRFVLA